MTSITNYKNAITLSAVQRVEYILDTIAHERLYRTDLTSLHTALRESLIAAKNDFDSDERLLRQLILRIDEEALNII